MSDSDLAAKVRELVDEIRCELPGKQRYPAMPGEHVGRWRCCGALGEHSPRCCHAALDAIATALDAAARTREAADALAKWAHHYAHALGSREREISDHLHKLAADVRAARGGGAE